DRNVTLTNTGTGPLTWEARERDQGATAPELPPAPTAIRKATWGPQRPPAGFPKTIIPDTTPGPGATPTLSTIITDPAGDSLDSNDVTTVRAGSDGSSGASMALDFSACTPMGKRAGDRHLGVAPDGERRRLRLLRHRPERRDRPARGGPVRPARPGHRDGVLRRP